MRFAGSSIAACALRFSPEKILNIFNKSARLAGRNRYSPLSRSFNTCQKLQLPFFSSSVKL
jgi:hypothetical protein